MPSLQDIAKQISSLAQLNLQRQPTRAIDTGNLLRKVKAANTPATMVKELKTKDKFSFEIELDYAPPGAEYGAFVENGTSKQPAQHFAQRAIDDPYVSIMIDEYVGIYVNENVVSQIQKQLDDMEID